MTSTVNFDSRKTVRTSKALRSNIINSINTYVSEDLYKFEQTFRLSKLQTRIDETDSSILGNDSAIRLKKTIIPALNTKLSYILRFNNAFHHPHDGHTATLSSTLFSITDEQNILRKNCKIKDHNGLLTIYRTDNEGTEFNVRENIGSINYVTGKVVLNSFDPASYAGTEISFTGIPVLGDVLSLREQLITIQEKDINLKMNDTSIVNKQSQVTTAESETSQTTVVNY